MSQLDPPAPVPPPVPEPNAPSEPLITVGTITAAGTAVLALLVVFGVDIDKDKQVAILGVVTVLAPLVVMAIGRGRVFSPATVRRMMLRGQR